MRRQHILHSVGILLKGGEGASLRDESQTAALRNEIILPTKLLCTLRNATLPAPNLRGTMLTMYRLFLPLLLALPGCAPPAESPHIPEIPPQRIIATLPSIVEVLFDIGLGDRIIAVSDTTNYPPEAATIEKIGGHFDINREKIISLRPDLIILPAGSPLLRRPLSVPVQTVDHDNMQGVLASYIDIGELFGEDVLTVTKQRRQELLDKLHAFEARAQGKTPWKTLIAIDRSHGTGRIQHLFVAGRDSFLTEVVALAGGENVAASMGLLAPQLSAEGIIDLAPEVIIDIQIPGRDLSRSAADWQSLGNSVPAVRNNRILTLTEDFASIPGPRTPMLIERIAQYYESFEP